MVWVAGDDEFERWYLPACSDRERGGPGCELGRPGGVRVLSCEQVDEMLFEHAAAALSATDEARLADHLRVCPRCCELVTSYDRVVGLMRRMGPPPVSEACACRLRVGVQRATGG